MKKLLLGLVIALTMISNVDADYKEDVKEHCEYLLDQAESYVKDSKVIFDTYIKEFKDIYDDCSFDNFKSCPFNNLDKDERIRKIKNMQPTEKELDRELKEIKKAHYFAVTYSALCE